MLAKKGNLALAGETARRAEHFYTLLIGDYKWATWRHASVPRMLTKSITKSGLAHQKILEELAQQAGEEDKKAFEEVAEFSKRNYQTLVTFVEQEVVETP